MAQSNMSDTEELPIAAHIFEGHLYIKDEKSDKWLWRLFRFDGTSLTCLSSKKNKLPPHTVLDNPYHHSHSISSRPVSSLLTHSASTHSFTSPILATPKHRADRILASSTTEAASYDDANSSRNRNSQPISASYYQLPKWTIEMTNIASISLLKPKQRKSKPFQMPTSTKPKSFTIRTYDGACFVLKANKQHDLERWIFVLAKMWKFAQAARHMPYARESIVPRLNQTNAITLAAIGSGSTSNLAYNANDQMTTSPIQVSQEQQQQQQHGSLQLPMNALKASHVGQSQKHHHDTMLSDEKALWIENWVKSLDELEAHSPAESYSDVIDIVTTNTPAHTSPSTRTSSRRHHDPQLHTNDDAHLLQRPPYIRGDHSNSSSLHLATKSKPRMSLTRCNSDYLGYFQDTHTVYTDETSRSIQREPKPSLKYHNSVRGKPIRSHTTGHDIPMPFSAAISSTTHESLQHGCSPLALLEYKYSRDKQQLPSPPATPAVFHAVGLESDEDVCLADVRRSLQSLEISKMQAEQDLIAKRRSASIMVNASRRRSGW